MVASFTVAILRLNIVFNKITRVVFGAVFAGICTLRTKCAVKRVAVQIDGVNSQAQRARAAADAALFRKRHIARFVRGGALALVGQRCIVLTARRVQAAACEPCLRANAVIIWPERHVVGTNVLNARHRIGRQLLFVALASRLQIRPGVAVI